MGPATLIGRWLRADVRGDKAARARVPDDPSEVDAGAVLTAAFELAVVRRFRPESPVGDIAVLVHSAVWRYGERIQVPVMEMEMLIRETLGERVPTDEIDWQVRGIAQGFALEAIIISIGMLDHELDELLVEAERIAIERGYRPALAESRDE